MSFSLDRLVYLSLSFSLKTFPGHFFICVLFFFFIMQAFFMVIILIVSCLFNHPHAHFLSYLIWICLFTLFYNHLYLHCVHSLVIMLLIRIFYFVMPLSSLFTLVSLFSFLFSIAFCLFFVYGSSRLLHVSSPCFSSLLFWLLLSRFISFYCTLIIPFLPRVQLFLSFFVLSS